MLGRRWSHILSIPVIRDGSRGESFSKCSLLRSGRLLTFLTSCCCAVLVLVATDGVKDVLDCGKAHNYLLELIKGSLSLFLLSLSLH